VGGRLLEELPDFSTQPNAGRAAALAVPRHFEDTGAGLPDQISQQFIRRRDSMKNPLDSLWGTVIAGVVLTVVLYVFARNFLG
jgi:hypothetical protein